MRTYTNDQLTDEQLVAYADGELPADQAHAIAQAAGTDAQLARRIDRFVQTRRVLSEAFAAKLTEPVPQRLLDALAGSGAGAKVVPLRRAPRAWAPLALAASIALAIGLSVSLWLPRERTAGTAIAGLPPDAAMLAAALDGSASGEPREFVRGGGNYEILPTATLQTAAGWCREFASRFEQGATTTQARGVACRQGDGGWQVVAAATVGAGGPDGGAHGGEFAPAGGAGPDLAAALGGAVRLTPEQEAAVIRDNWPTTAAP